MLLFIWIMRPPPPFAERLRPIREQIRSRGPMRQVCTQSARPVLRWAVAPIKQETYDLHARARPNIAFSLPRAKQIRADLAIACGNLGYAPVACTSATCMAAPKRSRELGDRIGNTHHLISGAWPTSSDTQCARLPSPSQLQTLPPTPAH